MPAFIFPCDFSTEQECLDRKLFGTNPGENYSNHYRKIGAGDTLFLYNFDTGTLRGPYIAASPCKMNIEPAAWKKSKRNFPWQAGVDDSRLFGSVLTADKFRGVLSLAATPMGLLPPVEIPDETAEKLLMAMNSTYRP